MISQLPTRARLRYRAERGQALIVAIAVLFILLFIGALFVAQVARNLGFSGRSRDTQTAQALAEAGIRYCDNELTNSADGADWRPDPTPPITSLNDPMGLTDPDYEWLSDGFARIPMTGGRVLVRVTYDPHPDDPHSQLIKLEAVGRPGDIGNGEDPTVFVQSGNAPRLRREIIAYKQLGLTDYLLFVTNEDRSDTTNALGTPAIGHYTATVLNDPTDVEFPNGINPNGVNPDGSTGPQVLIGGGVRVNSDLSLEGDVFFYASTRGTSNPLLSFEGLQVSGNILLDPTRDVNGDGMLNNNDLMAYANHAVNDVAILTNPASIAADAIRASADPLFSTHGGIVRDGSAQADSAGYTRSIPYLDPPRMDGFVSGTGVLRYRALTRDSGKWVTNPNTGAQYNTGQIGWGTGAYVDDPTDLQPETASPGGAGGYSLPRDWVNPKAGFAQSAWQGPFYRPPGIVIELRGDRIILTRSDGKKFTGPDGNPITAQGGTVMEIPLADADRLALLFADGSPVPALDHDGDDVTITGRPYGDANSYGVNVVMMCEGNVRVKGFYGAVTDSRVTTVPHLGRVHLTIVTGGTAYIEGNIVKNDGYIDSSGNVHMERNSTCAILAKDYVCVNTTMFTTPDQSPGWATPDPLGFDAFYTTMSSTTNPPLIDLSTSFGLNPNTYQVNGTPITPYLLLRQAADNGGPSYINLQINPALDIGGNSLYQFNQGAPLLPQTFATGLINWPPPLPDYQTDQSAISPRFDALGFSLANTPTGIPTPGYTNIFHFQPDPTGGSALGTGSTDYLLSRATVAPLDIRIEALLFAQDRSFFVIPGYPFDPDPNDTRHAFATTGLRTSYNPQDTGATPDTADKIMKDLYPFYDEPTDIRITVFGAISENFTASVGDQTAWMSHWGWMPTTFGSTASDAAPVLVPDDHHHVHDPTGYEPAEDRTQDFRTPFEQDMTGSDPENTEVTRGLRVLYDPALAMPFQHPTDPNLAGVSGAIRFTRALRFIDRPPVVINGTQVLPEIRQTLPPVPDLPVCPGLIYFGDSDRPVM